VTGSSIWREETRRFEFVRGPIFVNFLLADEINRASARTQSALLEAMQERTVTWDGASHPLPEPFIVFATQNPIEQEGTYPLPLAQLDRFMFKVIVGYPEDDAEEEILRRHHTHGLEPGGAMRDVEAILDPATVMQARQVIRETFVRDEVVTYVQRLARATRDEDGLSVGASPRAALMLLMAAKCLARFAGRDFVTPDDVQAALKPCMRHRVVLAPAVELEGGTADDVLDNLVEGVEVPR
jgi:MoxR-like ATPase